MQRFVFNVVWVLLTICGWAEAATITGLITDPTGKGAFSALVKARGDSGSVIRQTRADDDGRYTFELPAGNYQIDVALAGFAPVTRPVTAGDAAPVTLDIRLELAATRTEVNVSGKALSLANSDPAYRQMRDSEPRETFEVHDVVLNRDCGVLTLKRGRISFTPPVLGRVTMAVFQGEGEFTLEPRPPLERRNLLLITAKPNVQELFDRVALIFTDGTYEEIKRQGTKGADAPPERGALSALRSRIRKRNDQPRSMIDALLTSEQMDNVEADILADLYNAAQPGFFSAYIFGKKHGDLRFAVRPRGALPGLLGPEEVALINLDPGADEEGIWYLAHHVGEYERDKASSREDKRTIHADHYRIETVISRFERLTANAAILFTAVKDGDRVIKFGLLPSLRVTRVASGDREIEYIQERRKEDGSFYVIWPEPLKAGRPYQMLIEYEGNKVIHDEGGGNFAVGARTSWYPSVNSFADRSTFDLTFQIPDRYRLVAVGKLTGESREHGITTSQWSSDVPLAVAGFNYGDYKQTQVVDSETKYTLEAYATSDPPAYLRGFQETMMLSPSVMAKNVLTDAQNSIRVFSKFFGDAPYGRIAITQQPQFNSGQSWPTLVYLPVSAFLDSTQRLAMMGHGAFRFADFIDEVTPHEVSHQWWGHIVGWASYHDQWLSEGFADFSAGLYLQLVERKPDKYLKYLERSRKMIFDGNEFGVRPNDAGPLWMGLRVNTRKTGSAYRRVIYPKGGFVLHMIRMMMWDPKTQDEAFIAMMRDYVSTYRHQSASTEDFQATVEKHMNPVLNAGGNRRMDWFFREWVYGTEAPSYHLKYTLETLADGKSQLRGTIQQEGVSDNFLMPVTLYLDFTGVPTMFARVLLTGNSTSKEFSVALPKKPKRVLLNAYHDVLAAEVTINGKKFEHPL